MMTSDKDISSDKKDYEAGRLLEQIVTASTSLLKEHEGSDEEREYSEDGEEEVFEDGDEDNDDESDNESDEIPKQINTPAAANAHESVAAVLTELSQATSSLPVHRHHQVQGAYQLPSMSRTTTSSTASPHMAATINSINALLQSHLNSPSISSHKVRLSGPIRANVNIRHGVWAPRLRCRKRKNLHAKDGIWIHPTCTLDHLIALVKSVLPDEFEWDAQGSPLRYQAVNDQSLQSLKTVSGTVASGQSLYSAFDLVRNRRSDGDNFVLQLYVYGTWTVLLKPHLPSSSGGAGYEDSNAVNLQPPPKKKYQQAHYLQMSLQPTEEEQVSSNTGLYSQNQNQMRLPTSTSITSTTSTNSTPYTHPLAANPPVTFLPTVTLEMKLNGTFLPVEVSRRSFIAAIRACSIPKQQASNATSTGSNPVNTNNMTPPPSDA